MTALNEKVVMGRSWATVCVRIISSIRPFSNRFFRPFSAGFGLVKGLLIGQIFVEPICFGGCIFSHLYFKRPIFKSKIKFTNSIVLLVINKLINK